MHIAPRRRVLYTVRWAFVGCLTGMIMGPVTAGLCRALAWMAKTEIFLNWRYMWPLAGGAVVGLVIHSMHRKATGEGAPTYIASVNMRGGFVGIRMAAVYAAGVFIAVGTGLSGGMVGPITLIGGGVGSTVGRLLHFCPRFLHFSRRDLRQTTVCGAAAGVAALLGTPLGAGIFAVELLSSHAIDYGYLFPALMASCVGAMMGRICGVPRVDWRVLDGAVGLSDVPLTFVCLFVVALVTGLLGICFVMAYKRATEIRARMPYWAGPIVGAVVCTGCALALRQEGVLGSGAPILENLLENPAGVSLVLCLALVVGKSLATVGVIGGGANAGLTMPLLVVGGLVGAACVHLSGLEGSAAQSLVVCGSAAMVSAVLNVPIAAAAICVELFGVSGAVPAALGSAIGFMVAKTEVVYSYSKA